MKLRELLTPFAVLRPGCVQGGTDGHFHNFREFNFELAEVYLRGQYDSARFYGADGGEYEVVSIELSDIAFIDKILRRLGHLLVLPDREKRPVARVDMELRKTRDLSLEEFKAEVVKYLKADPRLWKHEWTVDEIEHLFDGANTFEAAIDKVGYFAASYPGPKKQMSNKVTDRRT